MTKNLSPKIVVKDLSLDFPDQRRRVSASQSKPENAAVPVLENINMDVQDGEFICIVGPSGCGKSTLLNVIGGFLQATSGQVLVNGEPVKGPDPRGIFIFQENGVFPWLTVEDNIGFGLFAKSREQQQSTVKHYIEMVGLKGFEKSYPREISGGMKQRVEIARALAANPEILFMDEPFGALDFLTRLHMRAELVQIWQREKKTVLFVTHDVEESVQLADRIVVMSPRPATIRTIIDNKLPRPRDLDAPEYLSTRDEIFEIMGLDHAGLAVQAGSESNVAFTMPSMFTRPLKSKKMDADVIVIGGGPAGAVLGTYLARAGIDHLLVERAHYPRAHVGESLSYSSTAILKEIDFLPIMEREGFIRKHGVSWTSWLDHQQVNIDFEGLGQPGHAFQVDRAKFDDLLLKYAREQGTRVFSGANVDRIDFNRQGQASGVTVKVGESRFSLKSRLVVDASGRPAVLGHQLKLVKMSPDFPQNSVHSWFSNVERGESATDSFTHIHLLPFKRGWAWQIPIDEENTSIGVVMDRAEFVKSGEDVNQFFQWALSSNSVLAKRMQKAKRLREFRMESHQSYAMEKFAGEGWLMVGDAAFFTDPIFSSGISDGLQSAKFAAEAISDILKTSDDREARFASYDQQLRAGALRWQKLAQLFYEVAPIFARVLVASEHRHQLLRMCEGDVYDSSAEQALDLFRKSFDEIREFPDHPFHKSLVEVSV